MLIVGVGIKLSFAPFHLWVPDVFEGAPGPVAAYLATVSKVAVFAVLVRLFVEGQLYSSDVLMDVLSVNAVLSIVFGNLLALLQTNVKRLLAYSSIAHFGYVLVAFISAGAAAVEPVGVYLVAYVLTTLAAFGVVTLISCGSDHAPGDRTQYAALFWRAPYLAVALTIALLSLAGIPMTAGFIAKFYVINAGVTARLWILVGAVLFGSAVGLFYYIRVLVDLYRRPDRVGSDRLAQVDRLWGHAPSGGVLFTLLVLILALGLYPSPLIAWVHAAGMN
jgi:NADH-quinone oxidoreductase subunit N